MAGRCRLVALVVSLAIGFAGPLAGIDGPTAWGAEQSKTKPDVAAEKPATDAAKQADLEYYELYKILADTMYQVEQNYVTKVDRRELMEAAIRGVLDKLDPYSNYISPDELGRFKTSVENQFGGIGIQITMDGGQLHVLSPIVGSPAYRAGLQAGDAILEIEGKSTEGITLDDAVRRLKGEAGTQRQHHRSACTRRQAGKAIDQSRDRAARNRAGRPSQARRQLGFHARPRQEDRLHPPDGL